MPGPQAPYSHPGPSNYYHHQPPPPPGAVPGYAYQATNGHSGPGGPYPYGYPAPPPQHLNGHGAMPPSSPRSQPPPPPHTRTAYHDGPPRAAPHPPAYPSYHHHTGPHQHQHQHQHPHPHPHPPFLAHAPGPHTMSPHSPTPYAPQKFLPPAVAAVAAAAGYAPAHPQAAYANGAPYPPPQNWQTQPPISPLPKHLAMPPPPSLSPLSGQPPRPRIFDGPLEAEPAVPSPTLPATLPAAPPTTSVQAPTVARPAAAPESVPEPEPAPPLDPAPEPETEPEPEPEPASPVEAEATPETNKAHADAPEPGPSRPASRASPKAPPSPRSSRSDSVSAPASTAPAPVPARAPAPVPTPVGSWAIWSRRPGDPSRAPAIIFSPRSCPPSSVVQQAISARTPPASPILRPAPLPPSRKTSTAPTPAPAPGTPDVLSSSATDISTAPDTPMPGSPLSSNTSVSASVAPPKPPPPPAITEEPAAESAPAPSASAPSAPAPSSSPAAPSSGTSAPSAPVAPTPAPAAPKKSWASLLRSNDGASSSKLPMSAVIGFSVPASPPPARVAPARRAALVALLQGRAPPPTAQFGSTMQAPPPPITPRGLVNSGNMCFANAVLQLLVYCQPFWRLFSELGRSLPEGTDAQGEGATPLVDATVRFLKEFVPSPEGKRRGERERGAREEGEEDDGLDSFMPTYVYEAMKEMKRFDNMRGQHQEDAEEFFGFYLDTLEEELLALLASLNPNPKAAPAAPAPPRVEERVEESQPEEGWMEVGKKNRTVVTRTVKGVESPITRVFGGKFRSTLRVPGQRDSVVVEDWRSLQLDIQKDTVYTIRDALVALAQPQTVQVVSPTRPGTMLDASQQVTIDALPPVLVLHLKRFLYDVGQRGVVKIGKQVAFAPELEIPSEVIAPGKRTGPRHYRLYGVLYHHGISASGGHYTLDILHPNRDLVTGGPGARPREAWVRFDDELVSDVRPEDVFGPQERDDRCAYLLFYRQVGLQAGPGAART